MRCSALILFLLLAGPASAQDARGGFGVGVRVTNVLVVNSGLFGDAPGAVGTSLLLPMTASPGFRVEPEIGFGRSASEGTTSTQISAGIGLLATFNREAFTLYTGGRFRYVSLSSEVDRGPFGPPFEQSFSGIGLSPVLGGEHYFSRWFSLGAEAGVEYARLSTQRDDVFGENDDEFDTSSISTQGSVFIRFYLN